MKPASEWADELCKRFCMPIKDGQGVVEEFVRKVQEDVMQDQARVFEPGKPIFIPEQETLRDRFAMAALTGLLSNSAENIASASETLNMTATNYISSLCYKISDAMLAERDGK